MNFINKFNLQPTNFTNLYIYMRVGLLYNVITESTEGFAFHLVTNSSIDRTLTSSVYGVDPNNYAGVSVLVRPSNNSAFPFALASSGNFQYEDGCDIPPAQCGNGQFMNYQYQYLFVSIENGTNLTVLFQLFKRVVVIYIVNFLDDSTIKCKTFGRFQQRHTSFVDR